MINSHPYELGLLGRVCRSCWDTGVVFGAALDFRGCPVCKIPLPPPSARIYETLAGQTITEHSALPVLVGLVISTRCADRPIALAILQSFFLRDVRSIKKAIEVLRKEWQLPIGSTRDSGYYWMRTPADFIAWSRSYRNQAITSLTTLSRMQRRNFPELAGQTTLDFVDQIATELREAL